MTAKKHTFIITLFLGSLITSCNLYSPLQGGGSELDHLEVAQKCLTDGNYVCAAAEYNALAEGQLKQQKLCTLYITQAGFGLSQLINVFTNANSKVLGKIANAILPYNAAKLDAIDKAKTACTAFNTLVKAGTVTSDKQLGALLSTLSLFTSCGVRLGKATTGMATSDTDTACTTTSTTPNSVSAATVSAAGDGSVSAGQPGMCPADAIQCAIDLTSVDAASIRAAGFDDVATAAEQIPAAAKNSATGQAARIGLLQTI